MLKFLIICSLGIVGFSCSGQVDTIKMDTKSTDSGVLIDPVEVMPFIIERESQYVQLPDSLGGNTITGLAFIGLYINEAAKVQRFNIIRLYLKKEEIEIIDYLNTKPEYQIREDDYPDAVKRYYKFIAEYIASLKIVPAPNVKPKKVTIINLPLRFK